MNQTFNITNTSFMAGNTTHRMTGAFGANLNEPTEDDNKSFHGDELKDTMGEGLHAQTDRKHWLPKQTALNRTMMVAKEK